MLYPERLEASTIEQLRQEKPAVLRALQAERLAVAVAAQHLLREGRFPCEPAPCVYHCGHAHGRCRRCGATYHEHYVREREVVDAERKPLKT